MGLGISELSEGDCFPPDEHTISGINGLGDDHRQAVL
jgi:hypothetical protein